MVALRMELMQMDIQLRRKQVAWKTPRNIAILAVAIAALAGAFGGCATQTPAPAPVIIVPK
jgi:hypothetical protein